MIRLTRLNRSEIVLNAVYIERIEAMPDTVVTLTTGRKVHVLEPVQTVIDLVTVYYRDINILPKSHDVPMEE
ncbi:flagellar FlbD family protein [Planococcus rifietoensis]|uniref:flagellar FlbD family protein n=1 Tax=Planococcus rifietoensis TaxID=200991 RepID=UPI003850374C